MRLPRTRYRQHCGERGSGTVAALGIIAALLLLLGVVHAVTAASTASAQANRAADMAALAAADAARGLFSADPCTVAAELASRHQAELLECSVHALSGEGKPRVEVQLSTRREVSLGALADHLGLPSLSATATSRAGPPSPTQ